MMSEIDREYCRDIGCHTQQGYDNGYTSKERLITYCESCEAYKYARWKAKNEGDNNEPNN